MFSLNNETISPSRTLLLIYSGVYLSALFALFYAAIPTLIATVLAVTVISQFLFFLNERVLLSSPLSIVSISWDDQDGLLVLGQRDCQRLVVTKLKQKLITPYFIILLCECENRYYPIPVVIMRKPFGEVAYRRLRVLLQFAQVGES